MHADRRALFGAAALGSCLGLALGGAYLAGGLARAASAPAPSAVQVAALRPSVSVADAAEAPGPLASNSTTASTVPRVAPFTLRSAASGSRDQACLSQAVYYEARGEGETGMAAVAQVVLNRVRHPRFPKSVCAVVFQDCQFSFVCDGSIRRGVEAAAWRRAEQIAKRALTGSVMADVGAATDFRVAHIPAFGLQRVAQIGSHVFYRFAGRLGQAAALNGAPQPSSAAQITRAAFTPPSAEQMFAVGAKVMERAALVMVGPPASAAPAANTAPVAATPAGAPTTSEVPAGVKPAVIKAAEAASAATSTAGPTPAA